MYILVACEESQAVTIEFRKLGHEAYSCDLLLCSGGHPEWHILGDVLPLLNGHCSFYTVDGVSHVISSKWDMIIAFPPCTYLTNAGNRHFSTRLYSFSQVHDREIKRIDAFRFFLAFATADCDHIAIENPVGYANTHFRKPDQVIHPYYFAGSVYDALNYVQKRTCLWLKGLPKLVRTNNLKPPPPLYISNGVKSKGKRISWCEGIKGISGGQIARAMARSKTFPGVARAMAIQWGTKVCH